jgi:hypothetical protein
MGTLLLLLDAGCRPHVWNSLIEAQEGILRFFLRDFSADFGVVSN